MENALLVGLSRQMALGRELDVIANNMANVSTNGFKARASRFASSLMPEASADAFGGADRRLDFAVDAGTALDISAGPIEATRSPLDVAIRGDGFLVLQTDGGERYTRNGALTTDAKGQLVTSDGYPVAGDNGPITFDQTESGISIAADGTVASAQSQHGHLRIVRFADPRTLKNEGANTFSSSAQPQPVGGSSRLEAGALERSNVRPVIEMTRLIEVNRAYANVAGLLGRLDELKRSAVSKLADMSAA